MSAVWVREGCKSVQIRSRLLLNWWATPE